MFLMSSSELNSKRFADRKKSRAPIQHVEATRSSLVSSLLVVDVQECHHAGQNGHDEQYDEKADLSVAEEEYGGEDRRGDSLAY